MSRAEKVPRYVVVITDLRFPRIVFFERVAADVALRRIIKLFSILGTRALHRTIRPKLLYDYRLPLNEHVQKLGERIFPDLPHSQLVVLLKS